MAHLDSATLDAMRTVGDPAADDVIRAIYPKGHEAVSSLNKLLGQIIFNGDEVPGNMPEPVRTFLEAGIPVGRKEGGWDEARLLEGAEFFEDYGLYIPLLLQVATMPILYAARKGVQVLAFTERLEKYAHRRSIETGQLTFDVMDRNGFLPQGKGQRSAQKVRLMHAAVRHFIQGSGRWNQEEFGVPINQEDLLGTLGAFSVAVIDALRKTGAAFDDREAEDFYYRWRVVGELMGIAPEWIAADLAGARQDFELVQKRQNAPCPESRRLIRSWILTLEEMLPGKRFDSIIGPTIRYMVGPEISEILGLETENTLEGAFGKKAEYAQRVDRFVGRDTVLRTGLNLLAYALIQSLYVNDRGLKRHSFSLPTSVANRWHIRVTNDGLAVPMDTGGTEDGACTVVFNDFAASLGEQERETLHASVAMLIGMVVRADGSFDLLERSAVSKVMDYQVPKYLGDDFRWSFVARREYQALCEGSARHDERAFAERLAELARLVRSMPEDLRSTYKSFVSRMVLGVAEASGTALWFGMRVGREEKAVLRQIVGALGIDVAPEVAAKFARNSSKENEAMIKDLAWVPIFENVGKDDLAKLEQIAKKKTLPPKTVVFFEGDRADAFYIVVSGSLKVYQTSQDGREKVLNTMGPGEIFGEIAMLDGKPRSASVETIEAAELIVMTRTDFRELASATPSILWGVLEGLCDRLRSLNDSQLDMAFQDTPYRIAKAVVKLADKHGEKTDEGWHVRESFGVRNLADMAATTPARVSRVLEKLEDDGLIRTGKDDLVVPDLAALRRAIEYMGSR